MGIKIQIDHGFPWIYLYMMKRNMKLSQEVAERNTMTPTAVLAARNEDIDDSDQTTMRKIGKTMGTEITGGPMSVVILIEKTHLGVVRKVMRIKNKMNRRDSFRRTRIILVAEDPTEIGKKAQGTPHETADKTKEDPMDQEIEGNSLRTIEDEEGKAMILPAAPDHPTVMTTEGVEIEEDAVMVEDRVKVLAGTEVKGQAKAKRRNPTNSAQTRKPLGEKCSKGSTMKKKCVNFTKRFRSPGTSFPNLLERNNKKL